MSVIKIAKFVHLKGENNLSVSKEIFEREILKELNNRNVAVLAGAGLSRGSGYVNWKELLRTIASDMGLNIDKEIDLVAVAQYRRLSR